MNVEIGTEAAQFPKKEYINVVAVHSLAIYSNCFILRFFILIVDFELSFYLFL